MRGEGEQTRAQRLKGVTRGPGVFVYDGSWVDHEWTPTMLKHGKKEPVFDDAGNVVLDGSGRQVFHRTGTPVLDENGRVKLGGPPKIEQRTLDSVSLWGVEFAVGEYVSVSSPALALKLRCLGGFEEIDGPPQKKEAPKDTGPEYTRHDLMRIAKDNGVVYDRSTTREELVAALTQAGIEV